MTSTLLFIHCTYVAHTLCNKLLNIINCEHVLQCLVINHLCLEQGGETLLIRGTEVVHGGQVSPGVGSVQCYRGRLLAVALCRRGQKSVQHMICSRNTMVSWWPN